MKFFKNIFNKVLAITCGSSTKFSKESSVKLEPIESEFSKLARDGHKFDRAKLDAMLVKLSESPTLEVLNSPHAMCYSIYIPRLEQFEVATGCSAATDFFVVGANGKIRVCNHSPVELVYWDNWRSLPECSEWMHYVRHDYLPDMCVGCRQACECLGACREAASVFSGSPTDPDPLFAAVRRDS